MGPEIMKDFTQKKITPFNYIKSLHISWKMKSFIVFFTTPSPNTFFVTFSC